VDAGYLERALELAERGRGTTRPNPIVGAVVVAGDEIVGEGWHERKGAPHAEVLALAEAGERARGAELYVTLEPCAHHGTTPPCTDAIVDARIARVVAGQLDPNPAQGGGLEKLRVAGVDVELVEGELAFRCRQQIEEWRAWVTLGRPFVTYKVALTLDGRVSVRDFRWVSGEASRSRTPSPSAWALSAGTIRGSTPVTSRSCGSRGGSPSGAGRFPRARSSS
jgi:diaminohydroxyphosphoribosylaminopyrimidine deaminase/5-amino-6-(5-phosphoribosylamino)uracil reductase